MIVRNIITKLEEARSILYLRSNTKKTGTQTTKSCNEKKITKKYKYQSNPSIIAPL